MVSHGDSSRFRRTNFHRGRSSCVLFYAPRPFPPLHPDPLLCLAWFSYNKHHDTRMLRLRSCLLTFEKRDAGQMQNISVWSWLNHTQLSAFGALLLCLTFCKNKPLLWLSLVSFLEIMNVS